MIVDVTKNLQNPLRKPSELTADEIEELKSYDATSYSMRRIGLPYVVGYILIKQNRHLSLKSLNHLQNVLS